MRAIGISMILLRKKTPSLRYVFPYDLYMQISYNVTVLLLFIVAFALFSPKD